MAAKASRAGYERYKGEWVFDVKLVKDKKVMDVKADLTSGKFISTVEDKVDHDDKHDKAN